MKRTAFYYIKGNGDKLRKHIKPLFGKEINRHGAIYFEEASEREKQFLELVQSKKIQTSRYTVLRCTRKEIPRFPFFYLRVKQDREYGQEKAFDMTTACEGRLDEHNFGCWIGVKQKKKILIDTGKSKNFDIMTATWFLNPKIYIVSRRLKDLFEEHGVTGCKFIPCLESGKEYPDEINILETSDDYLNNTTNHFQLLITETVNSPPKIGNVILGDPYACRVCGTIYDYRSETNPKFNMDDLKNTDFQVFDHLKTSNKGIIRVAVERAIVSSRILDLMLKHKVKGISNYLIDPPIPYSIVEIEGIT